MSRAKKNNVKPTIPDRVISYFNPVRGAQRLKARIVMSLAGGYTGASKQRRQTSSWNTSGGDADSDILSDLPTLRERSRDLIRNNPLATGVINTKVGNVVGTGLRLQSQIDAEFLNLSEDEVDAWQANIEREFKLWAESKDCDVARTLNFYSQQELAFSSTLENGDVFALLPYVERNNIYSLTVQIIEADRVCNPGFKMDNGKIVGGIERDNYGAPIAYHILKQHPGAAFRNKTKAGWTRIEAFGEESNRKNVLHLFRKRRPGQTRGVPDLAPVIESLRQLGEYTEAELTAAVTSAMFTVFVKSETGEGLSQFEDTNETGAKASDKDFKMASGAILELNKGEDIEIANPNRPNPAFDPFVNAILTQVGISLELPKEVLLQSFNSSYSASRAALEQAWVFFRSRRKWLVENFCEPIYEAWMYEAVALGRIHAPGFMHDQAVRKAYLSALWVGPAKPVLDLVKEANGRAIMEDRGWMTASENTTEMTGGDWGKKHKQRAKEVRMQRNTGLITPNFPDAMTVNEKREKDGNEKIDSANAIYMAASNIPAIEIEEEES